MNRFCSFPALLRWLLACSALVAVGAIFACTMTSPAVNRAFAPSTSSSIATAGTQVARVDDATAHVTTTEATEEGDSGSARVTATMGDIRPGEDSADPVAVTSAFITELTTRWPEETSDSWFGRWSRWATPALSSVWEDRGVDAYRDELDHRHGWSIGAVIGAADGTCTQATCVIYVVVDQVLVGDGGTAVADTYATWRLTLLLGSEGWRVDSLDDGASR